MNRIWNSVNNLKWGVFKLDAQWQTRFVLKGPKWPKIDLGKGFYHVTWNWPTRYQDFDSKRNSEQDVLRFQLPLLMTDDWKSSVWFHGDRVIFPFLVLSAEHSPIIWQKQMLQGIWVIELLFLAKLLFFGCYSNKNDAKCCWYFAAANEVKLSMLSALMRNLFFTSECIWVQSTFLLFF